MDGPRPGVVAVLRQEIGPGTTVELHRHDDRHLVFWSATATATVRTDDRDWLVPPTHALWMPAGVWHGVATVRPGHGYGVALDATAGGWARVTPLLVTPLVRELIVHLAGEGDVPGPVRGHAEALLTGLLEPVPTTTFAVPVPADPRARAVAEALLADPSDQRDLPAWASRVNSSVRTLSRLFAEQTGSTFARWRTAVRVRAALDLLARGTPVAVTARAVGYRRPAAFAGAFRRVTGRRPADYLPAPG
ncbi:helix-turn-helix transcriptional regulator [Pseudonocardia kongjuensis]|uniref:Helix-turn-helix transcriptional regulator n=1 Tax=Pseudonocardia kongjuensis TaxID=102227 RepID=A0ABP4IUY0_9PSEU